MGGISASMEKVQQSSVETESAAHQVNDAAQSLSVQSHQLEQDVSAFLSRIRE
jgi:methyl-accepting chemotaxis protein